MPRVEVKLLYALVVLMEIRCNTGAMESRLQDAEDYKALELCTNSNTQRLGSVFGNFTRHHKKELNLLYALVVLMEIRCNTGAMESRLQDAEDYKALELCTNSNTQRLGGVFGNFTRHHKKGHRRRTTTTPPTTRISSTTEDDFVTSHYSSVPPLTTNPDHPSRIDIELTTDVHRTKREVDLEDVDVNIYKEIELELSESSLTKSMSKVKKMYREREGSTANRVGGKVGKGIFLTDNCTTVVAQIGTTAILHCEVSDITENTVTWIRRKDYSLLSVGLVTYSSDSRFFSAHGRHVKDWALHVRFVTSADAGYYECQVPTHPPTSLFFKLVLVAAFAEIAGEAEKIIHEGSMLRLVCVVRKSTEPPSYVFWYFENRMINYDLNGVSVSNGRQTSELVIERAEPRHAGNYTCVPANARASSVTVHVIQSETPAAMQHGNNSKGSKRQTDGTLILSLTAFIILLILNR